jgi:hypothetical protein
VKLSLGKNTETALDIYSTILDGRIPYQKTALLEIEFSGTTDDTAVEVNIVIDGRVMLTQQLSTNTTRFEHLIPDHTETAEHELRIEVHGQPSCARLHIHYIRIEGLDMRLTMEDSGTCKLDGEPAVPSEYMGQVGYQSLKFTTPIYPWLLANERKDTYYYPH